MAGGLGRTVLTTARRGAVVRALAVGEGRDAAGVVETLSRMLSSLELMADHVDQAILLAGHLGVLFARMVHRVDARTHTGTEVLGLATVVAVTAVAVVHAQEPRILPQKTLDFPPMAPARLALGELGAGRRVRVHTARSRIARSRIARSRTARANNGSWLTPRLPILLDEEQHDVVNVMPIAEVAAGTGSPAENAELVPVVLLGRNGGDLSLQGDEQRVVLVSCATDYGCQLAINDLDLLLKQQLGGWCRGVRHGCGYVCGFACLWVPWVLSFAGLIMLRNEWIHQSVWIFNFFLYTAHSHPCISIFRIR